MVSSQGDRADQYLTTTTVPRGLIKADTQCEWCSSNYIFLKASVFTG